MSIKLLHWFHNLYKENKQFILFVVLFIFFMWLSLMLQELILSKEGEKSREIITNQLHSQFNNIDTIGTSICFGNPNIPFNWRMEPMYEEDYSEQERSIYNLYVPETDTYFMTIYEFFEPGLVLCSNIYIDELFVYKGKDPDEQFKESCGGLFSDFNIQDEITVSNFHERINRIENSFHKVETSFFDLESTFGVTEPTWPHESADSYGFLIYKKIPISISYVKGKSIAWVLEIDLAYALLLSIVIYLCLRKK